MTQTAGIQSMPTEAILASACALTAVSIKTLHALQGEFRLHYHRTLGGCDPAEAFMTGPDGQLADWLQPYDGLSDSSLRDALRQLGLQRNVRPHPAPKQDRSEAVLPWVHDSDGEPAAIPSSM